MALKTAGLVRHIGITGLPIKLYPVVLSRLPPGTLDVSLSYCHYCLNDRSLISILPQLEKNNVGVINASCLSMGLLTAAGPPEWHPAPQKLKAAAQRAATVATGHGQDISELALMWAVQVCTPCTSLTFAFCCSSLSKHYSKVQFAEVGFRVRCVYATITSSS